jgi:hypothetical protein
MTKQPIENVNVRENGMKRKKGIYDEITRVVRELI